MTSSGVRVTEVLSADEVRELMRRSDARALLAVAMNWTLVGGTLAAIAGLAAWSPWAAAALVPVAMVMIGNRQLGLAVLMHDCGHRALFRKESVNLWVGRWLCAAPVFADLDRYFKKHRLHHRDAGSADDPDLVNYQSYAVSKASFRRKILRDLTGRTGVKQLAAAVRLGGWPVMWRPLLINGILAAGLWAVGRAWLYLLWLAAWLTTNMLFSRLRLAAEHAVVPDLFDRDPRRHTRTTLARWWERLLLAPNHVNYHLEHHLLPGVPPYRLGRLHRLLAARGYYGEAEIVRGYPGVVRKLTVA